MAAPIKPETASPLPQPASNSFFIPAARPVQRRGGGIFGGLSGMAPQPATARTSSAFRPFGSNSTVGEANKPVFGSGVTQSLKTETVSAGFGSGVQNVSAPHIGGEFLKDEGKKEEKNGQGERGRFSDEGMLE
ncbi:hypothetical protein CC80DRAFT_542499 [Byssothecium circinans]|uniref:Uncharacterized protein n=1 Tax=Byssothecium circinans TaxID=147558 RepID=A0A6A5UBU3_9PLEO|nr:hypothetical protein CC80DRAFT_542499 [Byssothecium circinans]